MVADKSAYSANSSAASSKTSATIPSALRPPCRSRPTPRTRVRHNNTSGTPASSSTLPSSRKFSRSRTSRGSVCSTLTIMVVSMTTP